MEIKKSRKADLERLRGVRLLVSFAVALAAFFAVLYFPTKAGGDYGDDVTADLSQDIEMVPLINSKQLVAAKRQQRQTISDQINVIDTTPAESDDSEPDEQQQPESNSQAAALPSATFDPTLFDDGQAIAAVDDDNPLHFRIVEQLPEFPGGMVAFMQWLTRNLRYPTSAQQKRIEGQVMVAFIINKDGSVAQPQVISSAHRDLEREALRVLRIMPKWQAGEQDGQPCRS